MAYAESNGHMISYVTYQTRDPNTCNHRRIYHWAMPPLELRKISHMAKTYNIREVAPVENH